MPKSFSCIDIVRHGEDDGVLTPVRCPLRMPDAQDVLIKVAAAGVNRADVKQRKGVYPMPPNAPSVPGLEVSGTVVNVGTATSRWHVGDKVCALVIGGGYAEYCLVPEVQCLPIPRGMSLQHAAALPEVMFAIWTSLFEQARLMPEESVLIHGGASGYGTTAIQLAKAFGSRVITTAGTDDKCRVCIELGVDRAVNYKTQDFVPAVHEFTGNRGVNVIVDMVGAPYLERNLEALAVEGRLTYIAYGEGRIASFDIQRLMLRRQTLTGSTSRHRSVEEKGRIARTLEQKVWPLLDDRRVRPIISQVFSLADAASAHAHLEGGNNVGKVLLVPEEIR